MKLEKSVLRKIIKEEILKFITEAEDEKYTHIGYGKYKLKGKEDDENVIELLLTYVEFPDGTDWFIRFCPMV